jgi:hypothetical protein
MPLFPGMVERRHHRVFVTHNTEYHCKDGVCIAVRDRHSGAFLPEHHAIGKRVTGSFELTPEGGIGAVEPPESMRPGQKLCFSSGHGDLEHDILTSALVAVERPPKEIVQRYPRAA